MTYFEELGEQLEAAAVRLHRRRRRRIAAAVAAAVVAVAAIAGGLVAVVSGGDAVAWVVVEHRGERVSVLLNATRMPAHALLDELAAAGVHAATEPARTGPSLDGVAVSLYTSGGTTMVPDGDRYRLEFPADETVVVRVGSFDGTGPYVVPTDAFAPGEPLECIGWPGQAAADLARAAAQVGVAVGFRDRDARPTGDIDTTVVERAEAHGPAEVIAFVAPGTPTDGGCER